MNTPVWIRLDHTILVQDVFLEIDMVFTRFSVVSDVGYKRKKHLEVQQRGRNMWKRRGHIQSYSASAEEWPHCGIAVSVYLFQSFVLLFEFVDLSTICLGKGFAPLHCTCAVEGP